MIFTHTYARCDRCGLVANMRRGEIPEGWQLSADRVENQRTGRSRARAKDDLCPECINARDRFMGNHRAEPTSRTVEEQTPTMPVDEPDEPEAPQAIQPPEAIEIT